MSTSQRTVLFLGAGASKAFGYPLTFELMPMILEALRARTLFPTSAEHPTALADMETFERLLTLVLPGFSPNAATRSDEAPAISDVLSLLDELIQTASLMSLSAGQEELSVLRSLLVRAVLQILCCPSDQDAATASRETLNALVRSMVHGTEPEIAGVISTNYDISIDIPLCNEVGPSRCSELIDFGFTCRDPSSSDGRPVPRPRSPATALVKLHGSVNWLRCSTCDHVYINTTGSIIHEAYRITRDARNQCHCGSYGLKPVIVAPSYSRQVNDTALRETWRTAFELLRTSRHWIFAGYSMPHEDIAIRAMVFRAARARPTPPDVTVVQRGRNDDVERRYRMMFPQCDYWADGFESFVRARLISYESDSSSAARV